MATSEPFVALAVGPDDGKAMAAELTNYPSSMAELLHDLASPPLQEAI